MLFVVAKKGGLAIGLEEIGEDAEGVQRHMPEDVVEDVEPGDSPSPRAGE